MSSVSELDSKEEYFALQATGTDGAGALRQTVAERIAMHRNRRAAQAQQEAQVAAQRREEVRSVARHGVSRVRDAVAARYENSPSYREYLAAEAERALQQAQAEAEVAARNARAVAEAQMQLLEELEQWNWPDPGPREQALEQARAGTRDELAHALADIALGARELIRESEPAPGREATVAEMPVRLAVSEVGRDSEARSASKDGSQGRAEVPLSKRTDGPLTEVSSGGLTIKLYDGLETAKPSLSDLKPNRRREAAPADELHHLEEELALRHEAGPAAPHIVETTPIPANLIEFPRQLIAPRKVRPRLAEGPLRDEAPFEPQLRIFEVEAEQVAAAPAMAEPTGVPGWQELLLEATGVVQHMPPAEAQTQFTLPPQVAPMRKRVFAGAVDGACLLAATACFAELGIHLGGTAFRHAPLPVLGAAMGVALLAFYTLYQMLFFTLGESTPGMRVARIALCTFGDDNPTRKAMRRRVLATLLAACPLGIGLLWSLLDDEQLGWHDRMSRMYQRAY